MFHKINTKYLTVTFIALLALVLLSILPNQRKNRSFKSELTGFDTATVTRMVIYPKAGGDMISFSKKGNSWRVSGREGEYSADSDQVNSMLYTLSELKAKRLAAKDEDSWKKYELTDSLGTRIEALNGEKVLASVYVGKFTYTQPSQPAAGNPYQRPQGTMTSFVRLAADKEVYAVDGYLNVMFSRQLKDYRDSRVIQVQKNQLEQITISRPGQSFSLTRNGNSWMVDGQAADSTSMAGYLSDLGYMRSFNFIPNEKKPAGTPNYTLKLAGNNGAELAVVGAFYADSTNIAIGTSVNADTYFDGTKDNLFRKLFKKKSDFTAQ